MHPPTPPLEADAGSLARKRVCKACDRCRLKKSKCDGASPCSRCKVDNAICVFGERKKSQDKVYPKGYVEMLEQQQSQLVSGLQELYQRTQNGKGWTGKPLKDSGSGHPLTHDILESLGALKYEPSSRQMSFEEDLESMQRQLFGNGALAMRRQSSEGSESSPSVFHGSMSDAVMLDSPFRMNQSLPTPPSPMDDISPMMQSRPMFGRDAAFSRPGALQTVFGVSNMQTQSLPASAGGYQEFGYYDQFQLGPLDLSGATFNRHSMDLSGAGPCLVPTFVEDDDFSAFIKGEP
ncbi:MAG: hypothetical protein M1814_002539 [Vezdaea aestivalis]|nr:MAG: hypothetical protein M1814_002539 [Vezdaea aestivalis]